MSALKPVQNALEHNPSLGWLAGLWGMITGWVTWLGGHPTEIGKWFGVVAGALGVSATYYTVRVQRLTLKRMEDKQDKEGN